MVEIQSELCSCSALRQAARHVTRLYDETLAPAALGLNQYSILAKLDRHGPKMLQDLAELLVMERSTLGHLLRPLDARGLIAMTQSATDRRQRLISLSAGGLALLTQARPLWAKAEQRFEKVFGTEEALALRRVLKQIATADFGHI